jgi:hypothetical protein
MASLIISFQDGCSTADLEVDFLAEGFLAVADFFGVEDFFGVDFFGDLALRDNLERVEDFFWAEAGAGAGEARGDGRGEDIG